MSETKIEVVRADHNSSHYWDAVELRRRVLRKPLGLEFTTQELASESDQVHLVAFLGAQMVGSLSLVNVGGPVAKMRQVAVDFDYQGKGYGAVLVDSCEALALKEGTQSIELHARETAVPFYERLGYEVFGEPFEEVGIPHRKMKKLLISSS